MLGQECLGGASVAVKGKYQPVNTKRDNKKAGKDREKKE